MEIASQKILDALEFYLGPALARPVLQLSVARSRANISRLRGDDARRFLQELEVGLRSFVRDRERRSECLASISGMLGGDDDTAQPSMNSIRIEILSDPDIVVARGTGRDVCKDLGFPPVVQVKVATAISELARNIVQYAGTGVIDIMALTDPPGIEIHASDDGPGISNLEQILSGKYRSRSGMGMGITGTRNLVDEFEIDSSPGKGTRITIRKYLR